MAGRNRVRLFAETLEIVQESVNAIIPEIQSEADTGDVLTPDEFTAMWTRLDDSLELLIRARNEYCAEMDWDYPDGLLRWVPRPKAVDEADGNSPPVILDRRPIITNHYYLARSVRCASRHGW